MRPKFVGQCMAGAGLLCCLMAVAFGLARAAHTDIAGQIVENAPTASFQIFLDRLMRAESGGLANAKNPRSTALGPFQFIRSTFLAVTRHHFPEQVIGLSDEQILNRRADPDFSRQVAEAYSRDNVKQLKQKGIDPTFAQLRLAFLLGARDAERLIRAEPDTPVAQILSPPVVKANPFMAKMSANDLLAKSVRDVEQTQPATLVVRRPDPQPRPAPHQRLTSAATAHGGIGTRNGCVNGSSCRKLSAVNWRRNAPGRAVRRKA